MCGIAVHFNSLGWAVPLDLDLIRHRGPDSRGEWCSPGGRYWLGNTRLAIVDLSPTGAQPMMDPATGNVIVTNGEIYNHRAVREKLNALQSEIDAWEPVSLSTNFSQTIGAS